MLKKIKLWLLAKNINQALLIVYSNSLSHLSFHEFGHWIVGEAMGNDTFAIHAAKIINGNVYTYDIKKI